MRSIRHLPAVAGTAALLAVAAPVDAQSRRTATLPDRSAPVRDEHQREDRRHPVINGDEHLVVQSHGRRHVVRSCAVYYAAAGQPPQGGANSSPPGANGLPPAPGMQRPPGSQPVPGLSPLPGASAGSQAGAKSAAGTSSLKPLHSGWRTAGTVYYEGACFVRDRNGNPQLVYF